MIRIPKARGGTKAQRSSCHPARVGALVALLLSIGSVPSQASSFTFTSTELEHVYSFPQGGGIPYTLEIKIKFQQIDGEIDLALEDEFVSPGSTVDDIFGDDAPAGPEWDGWKCVGMVSTSNSCLRFDATRSNTGTFTGPATIFIKYAIFGWPTSGDPIDIGQTLDFSSFMIFSNGFRIGPGPSLLIPEYKMVRFHDGLISNITVGEHCDGNNDSFEACAEFNEAALVPEPGTTLATLLLGLSGLTVFGRRLKQRA